jgi:hypothetical protein
MLAAYRISLVAAICILSYFSEIARIFFISWAIWCVLPGLFVRYILLAGKETPGDRITYMSYLFPLNAFLYLWNFPKAFRRP